MKTPREVLFQRHHSMEEKLDNIRERVIAIIVEGQGRATAQQIETSRRSSRLQEFLLPLRWHLAGMTAAWIAIALLNIDRPSGSPAPQEATASPRQLLAELRENRRQILELVELPSGEMAAVPPPFVPRPRSEVQPECAIV